MTNRRIGIATDHGGFILREYLLGKLREDGFEVVDFGNTRLEPDDDYPDYVVPMARAVSNADLFRGIAICGSGVGACVAVNKLSGIRACMINETYSARQGVEDDNMNIICLGGRIINQTLAWDLVKIFLSAQFSNGERHRRRLVKVAELESKFL
jgi:ribose 5-phosphate isomerase B